MQYRACTATPKTCATNPTWGAWTDRVGETASDTATTDTIAGLTNGTAYQVQVRATNSVGDSIWSPPSDRRIPAAQKPDKPDAPTVSVWNQSLRLSWTAPADNGAAISDYDVQYRACTATPLTCASSPTWGNWTDRSDETSSDTGTSATVTGLTNGTAYQVQVRAANSVGDSAWSDASAKKTPAAQKPDAPSAPTLSYGDRSLGCVVDRALRATERISPTMMCATAPTAPAATPPANGPPLTTPATTRLTHQPPPRSAA